MPQDVNNPTGQEPNAGEATDPKTTEGEQTSSTEGGNEGQQNDNTQDSPLWEGIAEDHPVRGEVTKLRNEAAQRRATAAQVKQENENLQAQLADAKTPDEVQALVSQYETKIEGYEREATRSRIASEYQLPADLAGLLTGDDEAALKTHAETLAKYIPKPQGPPTPTPSGGRTPGDADTSIESNLAALRSLRR